MKISNKVSIRRIIWLFVIVLAIFTFTFSPAAIQSRNMQQAEKEITAAKKVLEKDARFNDVEFARSTASLGKVILVSHSCDSEEELLELKNIIKKYFDSKYQFIYVTKEDKIETK